MMASDRWWRRARPFAPMKHVGARCFHPYLEVLEDRLTPAVHEWTGLGANNLWSNPQNWTNGTPSSDLSGDIDLVFHTNLTNTANLVTQNDLTGLVVDSITFDANVGTIGGTTFANGGLSANGYTINGNPLTINVGSAGQDPFGIDIAVGVADPVLGITETFNIGVNLVTNDATFRSQQVGARLTITGNMDLGTRILTIDNTAGANNDAAIQGVVLTGNIGSGNVVKNGTGTLQLSGANSYANTTVNSGFVLVDTSTALGGAAGVVIVTGQVPTTAGQVQLRNGSTVVKNLLNLNSNANGGGLGANGNTTNTWRGPVVLNSGGTTPLTAVGAGNGAANAATRLIVDGVISGTVANLFINGAGTVVFTQNNTYTGVTSQNGAQGFGAIQIDAPAGLGVGGPTTETQLLRDGAGPNGSALLLNFNGTLEDTANVAERIQFAGAGVNGLGAIRTLGNSNVVIPGDIIFTAGAPWVLGVDGTQGSITTTGVISSQAANRALTKVGRGTLVIAGTLPNTYRVGTFINGGVVSVQNTSSDPLGPPANLVTVNDTGTLRVEAGITVPNAVQLNAGGTLAGTGTVNNNVTSTGGIVSPGASTGILSVVGDVVLDGTSTFRAEVNGAAAGQFDQLDVDGGVSLGGATLDVQLGFVPARGTTFVLIDNDGNDPVAGTFAGLPEGSKVTFGGVAFTISYQGGVNSNDVTLTALFPVTPLIAVGPDAGINARVQVFNANGTSRFSLPVSFPGVVRVASGDINNDGFDDVITGLGPKGLPQVRVFDGRTGVLLRSFLAFPKQFRSGVFVGAGDINNDGFDDILVGIGAGRGVRVFSGLNNVLLRAFAAYGPGIRAGVRVAGGDVNHDGFDDIITGTGEGVAGKVKAFSGRDGSVLQSFFAYGGFKGGVFVGAADINNDGFDDILTGTGRNATVGPLVKVFSGQTGMELRSFFAFARKFVGGVRVAGSDINNDGFDEILVGPGNGGTRPQVRVLNGLTQVELLSFFPYGPKVKGGIFVG